jgi:ADP-heptose:LPS heptosyltransferase
MAKGANARGKRIAFGDGKKIIWGPWSEAMFRHNPNVARPGDEQAPDLEWIAHYKGHRLYNSLGAGRRWIWNKSFHALPGELYFSDEELSFAEQAGAGFVLIEPNVPWQKTVAPNKDWGGSRYQAVAGKLLIEGRDVLQFVHPATRVRVPGRSLATPTFRHALAALARGSLYIGPEGGLHHGAAAVGIPAVVLFGGFIPPSVTGYPTHTNLTGGATACGKLRPCSHCKAAMSAISVEQVLLSARRYLGAKAA